ncbi:hypothetical protein HYH03_014669 [Edaphochlamys debaryana]|uniref:Uncharacterized protein n=1 Tax=Edaphochlamys debaryana TaxID=47281 RepID=A0A836BTE0_9CHLO|nr:hypothetical protein HYH03_014669 [Edaphochlamys debaryana]|eukprot:KAG2486744.1 hypothetical protein HYH03_014669 [Edaphochlamys debaryana]
MCSSVADCGTTTVAFAQHNAFAACNLSSVLTLTAAQRGSAQLPAATCVAATAWPGLGFRRLRWLWLTLHGLTP